MKCGACGYEYIREGMIVDDVVRFKQGARKGEIKKVDKKEITFKVGSEPFIELYFNKEVDSLVCEYHCREREISLYLCPKCKTVTGQFI